MSRILAVFTEVWRCARCKRWAFRLPKIDHGDPGGKGWDCERCGCTSIERVGDGRAFGPRSRAWRFVLEGTEAMLELVPRKEWPLYVRVGEPGKPLEGK